MTKRTPLPPVPAGSARYVLKILDDNEATLRHHRLAPGEHVVGSSPECAVVLGAKGVSRQHARLEILPDGGMVLTDLDSKNGTQIDGKAIRQMAIHDTAVIFFGPVCTVLYPIDEAMAGLAVVAQAQAAVAAQTVEEADGAPSTAALEWIERLAEDLRPLLVALAGRSTRPEQAAVDLTRSILAVLPVERVEITRTTGGQEVLVATAVRETTATDTARRREIRARGAGWSLVLETVSPARLERVQPLFELALHLLAVSDAASAPDAGTGSPVAEDAPPAPGTVSAQMQSVYRRCRKVARGDIPLLVLGESGSGKEVTARWIHERSRRVGGPFVAVNCAALPHDLLEAELFGIERGVATGVEARPGLFEQATGGTLFLDEIGDMPLETQAKVLRVLESTELFRVGGRRPVKVDVRFIAATHRHLEEAITDGRFRQDLYHRLAAFVIPLPPLRERRGDVALLAAHFFHRETARLAVASPGITRAALAALLDHSWPGNVRELQNEIAAAVLLIEPGEALDVHHLSQRLREAARGGTEFPLSLEDTVMRAEREAFRACLALAEGNHSRAMELLAVSRSTYYRKLRELGLCDEA